MSNKILVGMDELMDVRFAIVAMEDEDLATKWLTTHQDDYYRRVNDDIIYQSLGWSKSEWEKVYSYRNIDYLKASVVTYIIDVIGVIIKNNIDNPDNGINDMQTSLDINLYPYQFTNDDLEVLREIIEEKIPVLKEINFVNLNMEQLTPKFIKRNYNHVIMYDFNGWNKRHIDSLNNTILASVHFYIPRAFYQLPDDELLKDKSVKKILDLDIFKVMEAGLSAKIGITFIPISDFSNVLVPPQKKRIETKDLDYVDPSDSDIVHSSQSCHLFPFHQELVASQEEHQD